MPVFNNILAGAAGSGGAFEGPIKSVRFDADDTSQLSRTPSSAGSQQKFTLSTWVKRCRGGDPSVTEMVLAIDAYFGIYFYDDKIYVDLYPADLSSWFVETITDAVFRDNSAWYHIVISVDSTAGSTNDDRIKIWVNGALQTVTYVNAGGGSLITGDIARINTAVTHYIGMRGTQYPSTFYLTDYYWIDGEAKLPTDFGAFDSNGVWQAKAYSGTFGTNGFHLFDFANESGIGDDSSGNNNDWTVTNIATYPESTGNYSINYSVLAYGQNPYNVAGMFDGSTTTYAVTYETQNIIRFTPPTAIPYSSSVEIFVFRGNATTLSSSSDTVTSYYFNNTTQNIFQGNNTAGWVTVATGSGNINFIEYRSFKTVGYIAQAYWYAIRVDGTILVDYLATSDNDVLVDVPTNGADKGNYCTWNPLSIEDTSGGYQVLDQGNLHTFGQNNSFITRFFGTQAVNSGKYYWELTRNYHARGTPGDIQGGGYVDIGVSSATTGNRDSLTFSDTNCSADDIIGIALDKDNNTFQFYKNGTIYGGSQSIDSGDTSTTPYIGLYPSNSTIDFTANFGARPFAYSAPSGYKALCTTNLPTPTIADGSDYFDTKLYTGNATTSSSITQDITGYSFEPDLVWIKARNPTARQHMLYDQIRGEYKHLLTDGTDAEYTNTQGLTDFNSDGFSLGNVAEVNELNATYVAWAWDAGSDVNPVTNTDGSITSSVRANPTAGFSIVFYTGSGSTATVGHGLNAALDFIIVKRTNTTGEWRCWHNALPNTQGIDLNSPGAAFTDDSFNNTIPTSSVFTVKGGVANVNVSSSTYIAYCFSAVEGYSAFGSYDANSDADGPFVYTGFKVAWLMIKATASSNSNTNWYIYDATRDPDNPNNKYLQANLSDIEGSFNDVDFLSNGFKVRNLNDATNNTTRDPYIYIAFAENPFQANGGLAS